MITSRQSVHQTRPIEPRALRQVCGLFVTGVAVITAGVDGEATGTTVNSFTSVSLDPPMVLFCLHNDSRLHGVLDHHGGFTVNLLTGRQELVARAFAGRHTAVVSDLPHQRSVAGGGPILSDALAFLACRVVARYPGGDHVIVLGEVVELGIPDESQEPLIFAKGSFGVLEADHHAFHPIWDG